MATKPLDAADHHRLIGHHARKLRELAGKGSTAAASKARPMSSEGTKSRTDAKGTWLKKR